MTDAPAPIKLDGDEQSLVPAKAIVTRTDEERARDAALDRTYQQSLQQRPCGFFLGPAGGTCQRPTCGASWRAHYGDPPAHATRTPDNASRSRAAHRGRSL